MRCIRANNTLRNPTGAGVLRSGKPGKTLGLPFKTLARVVIRLAAARM